MEDFYNICNTYLTWIIAGITNFVFQNKMIKIIALIILFMFLFIYSKYYSTSARNKKFENDFISYSGDILLQVIKQKIFTFQNDDIRATIFFEQIILAVKNITKKYGKENVSVYQFVINEKPSNPYQLNNDIENNDIIFNNISSKDLHLKQYRSESMIRRKMLLDYDINLKAFSIYAKDGLRQQTFNDNVKKYKNKLFGKKIHIDKISGINENRRGQIFIIKYNKTGHFMIFREIGGAQAHNVATLNHSKNLTFIPIENLKNANDIANNDYGLYSLMQEFDLFLDI